MDLLTFLRVIVLVTNGVYCFVPRGEFQASDTNTRPLPIQQQQDQRHQHQQQQHVPANDISVYDPGVGKPIRLNVPIKYLRALFFGPTENYFPLGSNRSWLIRALFFQNYSKSTGKLFIP